MDQTVQLDIPLVAEDEVFKVVKNYNDYYENYLISNYGRLYSKNFNMILSQRIDGHGYIRYRLSMNGKIKYIAGQRLVAFGFISNPNPEKYNTVNHIDENPLNNKWTNLEWCDDKWNLNWATAQKRRATQRSKKVLQYDLENNLIAEYKSLQEASRLTELSVTPIFNGCHDGQIHCGFYWKYAS